MSTSHSNYGFFAGRSKRSGALFVWYRFRGGRRAGQKVAICTTLRMLNAATEADRLDGLKGTDLLCLYDYSHGAQLVNDIIADVERKPVQREMTLQLDNSLAAGESDGCAQ